MDGCEGRAHRPCPHCSMLCCVFHIVPWSHRCPSWRPPTPPPVPDVSQATMKRSAVTQPEQTARIRRGVHPRIWRKPLPYSGYSSQIVGEDRKQRVPSALVDSQHTSPNCRNPEMSRDSYKEAALVNGIITGAVQMRTLDGVAQLTRQRVQDTFERKAMLDDEERVHCSSVLSWRQIRETTQGQDIRLGPRVATQQPNGKLRPIDDAATAGQADADRLNSCTTLQPALHVFALPRVTEQSGVASPEHERILTGGEDWPAAYKNRPQEAAGVSHSG